MTNKLLLVAAGLPLLLTLSAPAGADPAPVKQVSDQPVIAFQPGLPGRVSYLRGAKAQFETPPVKIGTLQDGWHCGSSTDIVWNNKAFKLFSPKLDKSFRSALSKEHYPVPVAVDAIFAAPSDNTPKRMPELQVGMLIKDISANVCLGDHGGTGGAYMKVFWQIYSPEEKKVVLEAITEGSYQTTGEETQPVDRIFLLAFEQSARNLLAERGFYNAVTQFSAPPASRSGGIETLTLRRPPAPDDVLTKRVTQLRSSVATVINSKGSGSGFFISTDGYLLTNQHVVGNEKFVKIKLPTGRELIGEVLRSDADRDVALIKTEPIGVPAMSVRTDEANVGEDVYVIGSPKGDTFNSTLTRGIVSGYRSFQNQRLLQSDVAILHGNSGGALLDTNGRVIGVTVSRIADHDTASGMSFFIPINDALTTLKVELK